MPIDAGSRIGAYEILGLIGEGGMGRVFRARDTRLKREVAIKALALGADFDEGRLARFRREAEALAALNHPHIAAIHDEIEADGTRYLVLELVDGETLSDRIRRGPIAVDEAMSIARQIAEALEAAHARGIIHRDLKPANVKVTAAGRVKLLDFGLASIHAPAETGADDGGGSAGFSRATFTSPVITAGGVILGTAPYMSPEQARGEQVDGQSDIWAFGCVLYEMLTGRFTFAGRTVTDVLAAVIRADPDWAALPPDTPVGVRSLLRRCLQKERTQRLHHIADARLELEEVAHEPQPVAAAAPVGRSRERWAWAIAVTMTALVGLVAAFLLARGSQPEPAEMRVDINTPPSSDPVYFALSPDGQTLAFLSASGGMTRIWIRSLDNTAARPLNGTELGTMPFWSPDSRSLGFFSDGKLKRIDVASGLIQVLANAPFGAGGAWNRDGVIVFAPSAVGALSRVSSVGGVTDRLTTLTPPVTGHRFPQFLPDDRRFLFYAQGPSTARGVYVGSLDGGELRRLVEADAAGVLSASGHLLFVRQSTLLAQRFDLSNTTLSGDAVAVADEIAVDSTVSVAAIAASPAGPFAYRTGGPRGQRQLVWFDRAGKPSARVGEPDAAALFNPDLSTDGQALVVNRTVDISQDIWRIDLTRGIQSRLTFDEGSDQVPVWSSDGHHVVYSSNRKGSYDLYRKSAIGSGADEAVLQTPENKFPMGFSADGRFLLYRVTSPNTNWDLLALPQQGEPKPVPVAQTSFQEMMGEFAPDSRWVAYQSNESGTYEIYVQSFPTPSFRMQISTNGGAQPRWRRDGKELFYIALDGRLMAVLISSDAKGQLQAGAPTPLFLTRPAGGPVPGVQKQQYAVAADGQRFLVNTLTDEAVASPITLVLNWKPPTSQ